MALPRQLFWIDKCLGILPLDRGDRPLADTRPNSRFEEALVRTVIAWALVVVWGPKTTNVTAPARGPNQEGATGQYGRILHSATVSL